MQMDEVRKKLFLVREYVDLFSHTQKEVLVLAGAMQMDEVRKKPFLVREYVDLLTHNKRGLRFSWGRYKLWAKK